VRRRLKEGIWSALRDVYLDGARRTNKARRDGIAEEVHAVTALGEGEGELARNNT
jgi:hypothetical protein